MTSHFKVGGQLTELLKSCGDPAGQVMAEKMGVTPMTIHRWKKSDDMRLGRIVEIAEYFGMDLEEFLSWEENQ
tara:strand:+ start:340 stop:558 length:219 start_codon:yes stop_codon:yes gene_type:complete